MRMYRTRPLRLSCHQLTRGPATIGDIGMSGLVLIRRRSHITPITPAPAHQLRRCNDQESHLQLYLQGPDAAMYAFVALRATLPELNDTLELWMI